LRKSEDNIPGGDKKHPLKAVLNEVLPGEDLLQKHRFSEIALHKNESGTAAAASRIIQICLFLITMAAFAVI